MNENAPLRSRIPADDSRLRASWRAVHAFNRATSNEINKKMKTPIGSINRSPLRCGFFTLAIALCWFALVQNTQAVNPPPDGGYPGANTAEGTDALFDLTSGIANTAVGFNALHDNTTGTHNTAIGASALASNTTGNFNMAIGTDALRDNTSNFNLAIGFRVLFLNTTGNHLTGIGAAAMRNNTTASFNTAIGADALRENTISEANVAVGDSALTNYNGTNPGIDGFNTALGSIALTALTSGFQNTAVGRRAMESLTDGDNNTSVGWRSGDNLATGNNNTFLGRQAGANYNADESNNIVIGGGTLGTAGESNNIRIGDNLPSDGIHLLGGAAAGNFIQIGTGMHSQGISVSELIGFGTIQIGRGLNPAATTTFIGGIAGFAQPTGGTVDDVSIELNAGSGNFQRLGHDSSSRRYKEDIKPMDKASEALFKLKPVTYRIKKEVNPAQPTAFGLIAEDVAEACPDLVAYSNGQPESVHYKQVSVMILNEFLKEHKKVEEQQASIADLKSTVALQQKEMQVLTAQLKEQAAQIQKVSAQLEASKPAPKVVANK